MTVIITEETPGGIPSLVFRPGTKTTLRAPLVLLFQRFTVIKELDANLGYMLAKAGFDVVCPEADHHGSRFDGDENRRLSQFWQILHRTLEEVPRVVEACGELGIGDTRRVGVLGTSMGGFAACGAMVRYPWIQAGAALMGSAFFARAMDVVHPPARAEKPVCLHNLRDYDAQNHARHLANRPLYLWHGAQDNVVPCAESERLRDTLIRLQGEGPLRCIIDPLAGHKVTSSAVTGGVDFLRQYLGQRGGMHRNGVIPH